jgi:hypothetical protein
MSSMASLDVAPPIMDGKADTTTGRARTSPDVIFMVLGCCEDRNREGLKVDGG